jgi:hypothetical protein
MKRLLILSAVSLLTIVTTSLADVLPSDNFNDNSMNTSMWNLFQESPNVWLDETNQRLEVCSTADVNGAAVVYYANGWGFLTANNFSFKVDFHCMPPPSGYCEFGTMLGIGKCGGDPITLRNNNAAIDASSWADEYENGMHFCADKTTDGNLVEEGHKTRNQDNGILYISYDANKDELYLSDTGYWAANAWVTIPGLLKGEWGSAVVIPFLGGSYVWNISLNSGDVYLDNFVVDSGTVVPNPATTLPLDDFNDNSRNTSLWSLYQESPNVWPDETNERLEIRSSADANGEVAGYLANGWGFLTADNFSFRTDFHCNWPSVPEYSDFINILLGISKGGVDPVTVKKNSVAIVAGYYVDEYGVEAYFHCGKFMNDGTYIVEGQKTRSQDDGILYISYDANKDELYLSDTGYWAANAWITIPGLLKGEWDSTVVIPGLGSGFVDNAALDSGDAYLDNFIVDSGTVIVFGDMNGDGNVDFEDLEKFTEHWLETGCIKPFGCEGTDLDNDTDVDFKDFAIFAQNWLK